MSGNSVTTVTGNPFTSAPTPVEQTKRKGNNGDTEESDPASKKDDPKIGQYLMDGITTINPVENGFNADAAASNMQQNLVVDIAKHMLMNLFSNDLSATETRAAKGSADNAQSLKEQTSVAMINQNANITALMKCVSEGSISLDFFAQRLDSAVKSATDIDAANQQLMDQSNAWAEENAALEEEEAALVQTLNERYGEGAVAPPSAEGDTPSDEEVPSPEEGDVPSEGGDEPTNKGENQSPGMAEDPDYQRLLAIRGQIQQNNDQIAAVADVLSSNADIMQTHADAAQESSDNLSQEVQVQQDLMNNKMQQSLDASSRTQDASTMKGTATNIENAAETTGAGTVDAASSITKITTGEAMENVPATATQGTQAIQNGQKDSTASTKNFGETVKRFFENSVFKKIGEEFKKKLAQQINQSMADGCNQLLGKVDSSFSNTFSASSFGNLTSIITAPSDTNKTAQKMKEKPKEQVEPANA